MYKVVYFVKIIILDLEINLRVNWNNECYPFQANEIRIRALRTIYTLVEAIASKCVEVVSP